MDELTPNFLSKILRKRIENLGYSSLKKFIEDREGFRYSYELLRQVVYGGRIPRAETLLEILQTMRFSPSQIHKIMELHFGGFPGRENYARGRSEKYPKTGKREELSPARRQAVTAGVGADETGLPGAHIDLLTDSPEEISASLLQSLPKIPLKGNEDFWVMARALALQAERKVSRMGRKEADQPLLFEKEPEAIYQFLVRKTKVPSYMSKGESLTFGFVEGIDYRDRFRGALLGAAIGEILGRSSQGLFPRDIRELYGTIDGTSEPDAWGGPGQNDSPPACLLLSRALLKARKLDPEEIATVYSTSRGMPGTSHHSEFVRNLSDRGFPWFEAGATVPETAPAARLTPLALLRAGNFRRLKLEAGIEAGITHPHAAAIAGAIVQTVAIARLLHTPAGDLDVLGFARGLSPVVSGIEVDRSSRGKGGRTAPALWRKLGTELTALLLRRAEMADVQEALGNGASVPEGIPFAWACFLRNPADFSAAVFSAVNLGHEAEANGAMVGSMAGGYVGATGIPEVFLGGLPWREELQASADGLLALARRDS
jgi:ADP-ribosylglycohydrolase